MESHRPFKNIYVILSWRGWEEFCQNGKNGSNFIIALPVLHRQGWGYRLYAISEGATRYKIYVFKKYIILW